MRRSPCNQFISVISPSFAFSETDKERSSQRGGWKTAEAAVSPHPPSDRHFVWIQGRRNSTFAEKHSSEFMSLISLCDILICLLQLWEALSINQCQVTVWCNSTTQWSVETPISQNTHLLLLISASGKRLHVRKLHR